MAFTQLVPPAQPERTFRIVLDGLDASRGVPALLVRYAGPGNDAFVNACYQRESVPGKPSAERDRLVDELDAEILGQTVVVGWEHIYEDGSDQPCEFTPAKAVELLTALARHRPTLFRGIRQLARTEALFRDAPKQSAESLGKE